MTMSRIQLQRGNLFVIGLHFTFVPTLASLWKHCSDFLQAHESTQRCWTHICCSVRTASSTLNSIVAFLRMCCCFECVAASIGLLLRLVCCFGCFVASVSRCFGCFIASTVSNDYCCTVWRRRTDNHLGNCFPSFRAFASSALASLSCCVYTENRSLEYDKNDMNYHQNFAYFLYFEIRL
jgi:hypothetical protein